MHLFQFLLMRGMQNTGNEENNVQGATNCTNRNCYKTRKSLCCSDSFFTNSIFSTDVADSISVEFEYTFIKFRKIQVRGHSVSCCSKSGASQNCNYPTLLIGVVGKEAFYQLFICSNTFSKVAARH